ncbi:unnamed protein product [Rangifer tarandus platyrhynchus]|uniref:Uncharacterized protein n=2 Tax=Rangifer tarandus platyrhynchus TaxID=3082113 RepID=A0AC60A0W5_RANTA|nr:unnamed protein product [Rangifer tarandus platyrhynchus]
MLQAVSENWIPAWTERDGKGTILPLHSSHPNMETYLKCLKPSWGFFIQFSIRMHVGLHRSLQLGCLESLEQRSPGAPLTAEAGRVRPLGNTGHFVVADPASPHPCPQSTLDFSVSFSFYLFSSFISPLTAPPGLSLPFS